MTLLKSGRPSKFDCKKCLICLERQKDPFSSNFSLWSSDLLNSKLWDKEHTSNMSVFLTKKIPKCPKNTKMSRMLQADPRPENHQFSCNPNSIDHFKVIPFGTESSRSELPCSLGQLASKSASGLQFVPNLLLEQPACCSPLSHRVVLGPTFPSRTATTSSSKTNRLVHPLPPVLMRISQSNRG